MTSIEKKAIWLLSLLWVSGFALQKWNTPELLLIKKEFIEPQRVVETQRLDLNPSEKDSNGASVMKKADSSEKKERIQSQKININTATIKQLKLLPGIGPTLAKRIVEFRKKNSSFSSSLALIKVKGIGKRKLEKLLPHITF
jgi:competence ComEA-like helix-hairpin-helix protein